MLHMMSEEQRSKRKLISVTGAGRMKSADFLAQIFEAFEAGYVVPPLDGLWKIDAPVIKSTRRSVALYPKGYDVPKAGTGVTTEKTDEQVIAEVDAEIQAEILAEAEAEAETNDTPDAEPEGTLDEPEDVKVDDDAPTTQEEPEAEGETPPEASEASDVQEPTTESRIKELTKKAPLLALAKELGIEVPEDKSKFPAAIKQFLLTATAE